MATAALQEGRIREYASRGEIAINQHEIACTELEKASATLAHLESQRAEQKWAAILRLLERDYSPGKKFTATQANDFSLLDAAYEKYKAKVIEATLTKMAAELKRENKRIVAEYYVALVRGEAGLQ